METVDYHLPGGYIHDGMLLPSHSPPSLVERVKDFHLGDDGTFVVAYPKTGSTWIQEAAWLVMNDGDTDMANETDTFTRVPYMEMESPLSGNVPFEQITSMAPPRVVKTHLPARYFTNQLQNDQTKFLIPIRNPKDTLVSFFHFYRMNKFLGNYAGRWDEFFELFKANKLIYGNYFDWYNGWCLESDNPRVMFVHYEAMKKDLIAEIRRISTFLGKDLPDDVIKRISQHCEFEAMKNNKVTNLEHVPLEIFNTEISQFLRKGTVGDWKNYFSKEQSDLVDEMYESRLKSKGLLLDFQ